MGLAEQQKQMKNSGYSLVEVVLSAVLLSVVAVGSYQIYDHVRWEADQGMRDQLAWTNMATRMAIAVDLDYFTIQDSMPEFSVPITLDGLQGYRTTTVREIDDPFDGVAPLDTSLPDYLKVTVSFAWFDPTNIKDSLSVSISEERGWTY
ncbi:MAG: hypothetical protein HOB84_05090 [Candidatus Marinimicrobia bacterium]|jgi:hypothetical protein|nr:hypothetical protein [Candidatus Neomarinimicrobiota bacterium]MBT4362072.1 hypothetical protein [Candidatus Neomarinimicrobiota bacterium]MBT4714128.1 hypothetical protein [Candidatus Neomarinimicrobiota bacterium]MBT4946019.1 hypothetical protein [Candidatus Neomarinimicrobiota bacterium]MBT5270877.1 hypothetical protein [Candidatus Neomarinimicrobiota bacterium]